MTKGSDYLRYLELAKRSELDGQLRSSGFSVEFDKRIGEVSFDLIATKDGKTVAYVIKAAGSSRIDRAGLERLQAAAREAQFEFRIVVVNPPPYVNVEVDDLKSHLFDWIINNQFPEGLDSLSPQTVIDGLSDIEISDIRVHPSGIEVEGMGSVDVTLQYGGGSDRASSSDSYPFHFAATLNRDTSLASVKKFEVDTYSFSEN